MLLWSGFLVAIGKAHPDQGLPVWESLFEALHLGVTNIIFGLILGGMDSAPRSQRVAAEGRADVVNFPDDDRDPINLELLYVSDRGDSTGSPVRILISSD